MTKQDQLSSPSVLQSSLAIQVRARRRILQKIGAERKLLRERLSVLDRKFYSLQTVLTQLETQLFESNNLVSRPHQPKTSGDSAPSQSDSKILSIVRMMSEEQRAALFAKLLEK